MGGAIDRSDAASVLPDVPFATPSKPGTSSTPFVTPRSSSKFTPSFSRAANFEEKENHGSISRANYQQSLFERLRAVHGFVDLQRFRRGCDFGRRVWAEEKTWCTPARSAPLSPLLALHCPIVTCLTMPPGLSVSVSPEDSKDKKKGHGEQTYTPISTRTRSR
eukprot:2531516-Rhodomonas_salina.2